jgi:hypothetical protein
VPIAARAVPIAAKAAPAAIAALAAAFVLASCAPRPRPIVSLDEAFVETRPFLSELLLDGRDWGIGPFSGVGRPRVVPVPLAKSPAAAIDAANEELKRCGSATAIIASPLVAKAIAEGGAWSGSPALLVPGWRGKALPGLWALETDPIPAYRAAGAAAGAYTAALGKSGGSPSCGILYSEAPTRPRAALTAFTEAYAESSGGRTLEVRELEADGEEAPIQGASQGGPQGGGPGGPPPGAPPPGGPPPGGPGGAPGPGQGAGASPPAKGRAEAAVAELLGSDMRLLFVALGRDAGTAIQAAARPGLAIGADYPYPEAAPFLAFRIIPDDPAIKKTLVSRLKTLRDGSQKGGADAIPALLIADPPAGSIRAGETTLKNLVEISALRVKGYRQNH